MGYLLGQKVFQERAADTDKQSAKDYQDDTAHFAPVLSDQAAQKNGLSAKVGTGCIKLLTDEAVVARCHKEGDLRGVGSTCDLDSTSRGTDLGEDQGLRPEGTEKQVGGGLFAIHNARNAGGVSKLVV